MHAETHQKETNAKTSVYKKNPQSTMREKSKTFTILNGKPGKKQAAENII